MPRTTLVAWLNQNEAMVRKAIRWPKDPTPAIKQIVQPTLQQDVELHRARDNESAARARLKDATREIGRLQDRLDELEWAAKASFKPAEWTLKVPKSTKKSLHMPYVLTSDFQVGEVIREEETEHGYSYSTPIFQRRYKHLIETTIYLSFSHAGADWTYPGVIYARGGDSISGGIHDELAETDDQTPMEAVETVFEAEAWGVRQLAEAFGRVDVKDTGGGNHDRNTKKTHSKRTFAHSYDKLVGFMLRREFANDRRVTFQTSESMDVYFPIFGLNVLLTHGDRIGSRGGQGFIGPAATAIRGAMKIIQEQAALGRHVDRVDMGHFHTPIYLIWLLVNGCLPGYSEFAKMNRMRPFPPQQTLAFHHPKRGLVDLKPIFSPK